MNNNKNTYLKRTVMVLMSFILVFGMLFVNSGGSMYLAHADSKTEVPNESNKGSEYNWFGYDSYGKDHIGYRGDNPRIHDLKVNKDRSVPYQVYCFNVKRYFPTGKNSSTLNWYKRLDGSGTTFEEAAENATLKGDELNNAILRVIYNGYPKNANGIMDGLEELNAIMVTQRAVWYYSDSMTSIDSWTANLGDAASKEQKELMQIKLEELVDPDLDEKVANKVPDDYKLNIFMSSDTAFQNLLSGEFVPKNPPQPDEPEQPHDENTKVYISKVNVKDEKLSGATLKVTNVDTNESIEWATTNENHELSLAPGNYILKESAAPQDYITAKPIEFTVTKDNKVLEDGDEVVHKTIVMVDHLKVQPIKVRKVSANDDGTELIDVVGAKIEIYDGDEIVDTWTTEKGEIHEINIEVGKKHTFKEVSAPEGLQVVTTFNFEIDEYGDVKVTSILTSGNAEYKEGVLVVTDDRELEPSEPEKEIDIPKPKPEPYRSTIEIPKYKPVKPVVPVEEEEKPMIVPSAEEKKYVPNTADC